MIHNFHFQKRSSNKQIVFWFIHVIVADNQFRKDLIKSFGRQKSETLRKKVVETKDSIMHQIAMPYIMSDKSENKISSHLKLQSCICDHGASAFKTFNKKQLLCLERAYELNVSTRRDKKTICDNLVTSVPNFISIPNLEELFSEVILRFIF
jgi:hypothetical protein